MKIAPLPSLDAIGGAPTIHCWRLRHESDRAYAHRLALHLQQQIIVCEQMQEEFERLLTAVLAIKTNPELWQHPE